MLMVRKRNVGWCAFRENWMFVLICTPSFKMLSERKLKMVERKEGRKAGEGGSDRGKGTWIKGMWKRILSSPSGKETTEVR